jgi:Ni,Fe-hydrogenase III small subunit
VRGRSLHISEVDAGAPNGCEIEIVGWLIDITLGVRVTSPNGCEIEIVGWPDHFSGPERKTIGAVLMRGRTASQSTP